MNSDDTTSHAASLEENARLRRERDAMNTARIEAVREAMIAEGERDRLREECDRLRRERDAGANRGGNDGCTDPCGCRIGDCILLTRQCREVPDHFARIEDTKAERDALRKERDEARIERDFSRGINGQNAEVIRLLTEHARTAEQREIALTKVLESQCYRILALGAAVARKEWGEVEAAYAAMRDALQSSSLNK